MTSWFTIILNIFFWLFGRSSGLWSLLLLFKGSHLFLFLSFIICLLLCWLYYGWGSNRVARNDLRLDKEHLYFLPVDLCRVWLSDLIVMISGHRVHSYQLRDRCLIDLPFLDFEFKSDNRFLESISQLRLILHWQLFRWLHFGSRHRLLLLLKSCRHWLLGWSIRIGGRLRRWGRDSSRRVCCIFAHSCPPMYRFDRILALALHLGGVCSAATRCHEPSHLSAGPSWLMTNAVVRQVGIGLRGLHHCGSAKSTKADGALIIGRFYLLLRGPRGGVVIIYVNRGDATRSLLPTCFSLHCVLLLTELFFWRHDLF